MAEKSVQRSKVRNPETIKNTKRAEVNSYAILFVLGIGVDGLFLMVNFERLGEIDGYEEAKEIER